MLLQQLFWQTASNLKEIEHFVPVFVFGGGKKSIVMYCGRSFMVWELENSPK